MSEDKTPDEKHFRTVDPPRSFLTDADSLRYGRDGSRMRFCPKCNARFDREADYKIHVEACYGPPATRAPKWRVQVVLELDVPEDVMRMTGPVYLQEQLVQAYNRPGWTVLSLGGYGYDATVLDAKLREVGPT